MREEKWRWPPHMAPATIDDWVEVRELERDIVLLYHQIADDGAFLGAHSGTVFALPYWEYVQPTGLRAEPERFRFVQQGCLMLILAKAWDILSDSGIYSGYPVPECVDRVRRVRSDDPVTRKLVDLVSRTLEQARTGKEPDDLDSDSFLPLPEIVGSYFKERSHAFDADPQQGCVQTDT